MNTKKPASLSDSLLSNRPRKGEAKPQSEAQAARPKLAVVEKTSSTDKSTDSSAPRRRSRTTPFSAQLNLRVRAEDRDRFNHAAEDADLINGEFFRVLLDTYEATKDN